MREAALILGLVVVSMVEGKTQIVEQKENNIEDVIESYYTRFSWIKSLRFTAEYSVFKGANEGGSANSVRIIKMAQSGECYDYEVTSFGQGKAESKARVSWNGTHSQYLEQGLMAVSSKKRQNHQLLESNNAFFEPYGFYRAIKNELIITGAGSKDYDSKMAQPIFLSDFASIELVRDNLTSATVQRTDDPHFVHLSQKRVLDVWSKTLIDYEVTLDVEKGFLPVKWIKIIQDPRKDMKKHAGRKLAEWEALEIEGIEFEGRRIPFPKLSRLILFADETGKRNFTIIIKMTDVSFNDVAGPDELSIDPSLAETILDVDDGVMISVPK
jgi:hypothetical protein